MQIYDQSRKTLGYAIKLACGVLSLHPLGATATTFQLSDIGTTFSGFTVRGIDTSDLSGRSISGAGDVNGDGINDVIIGAPAESANGLSDAGRSFGVFGRTTNDRDVSDGPNILS